MAKQDFEKVIALDENHEKAYSFKGYCELLQKNMQAIKVLDNKAIRLNPNSKKHINRGTANAEY